MATWQHLRSSTANKRPTTSLADGRIAINTNTASPGLFFKDSAGTGIVKVGPVHVGTTAPNSVPASGGSTGNYLGEQWLDTSVSPAQMKVWNGSTWVGVVADELPVSKLQDGAARQLIQTDAAGTGVEWTSNVDVPGTLDVTSTATFDSIAQYPLGSAGAPTITFTGDNNTGIYSPGADQVAISTGGSGRLFVDASGNVGVGAANPRTKADISGNLYLAGGNQIQITNSAGSTGLQFIGSDSAESYIGTMGTHALVFRTGSTERLRITSAGLVGVGASTPRGLASISNNTSGAGVVDSSVHIGNSAADFYGFRITNSSDPLATYGGLLKFQRGTGSAWSDALIISNTGSVAVGNSSPQVAFHVGPGTSSMTVPDGAGASFSPQIFNNQTSGVAGLGVGVSDGTNNRRAALFVDQTNSIWGLSSNYSSVDPSFVIRSGGSERLRITSAGLVGVGASAPATLLEVRSATTNAARLRVTGTGTTAGNFRGFEFSNGSIFKGGLLQDESTDLISIFTPIGGQSINITSAGSLGVGTTPAAWSGFTALEVSEASIVSSGSGDAFFSANAYYDGSWKYKDTGVARNIYMNSDGIVFRQAASGSANAGIAWSEQARLDTSGRLGIGSSSPSATLHVASSGNPEVLIGGAQTPILSFVGGTSSEPVIGYGVGSLRIGTVTGAGAAGFVERVRVDTQGRVGIGTTSAGANLDLAGTTSRIRWDVNNAYTKQTCANAAFSGFAQSVTSAAEHIFQISDGEKARLDTSGRLLVGTSSGSGNNLLQIQGEVGSSAGIGGIVLRRGLAPSLLSSGSIMGRIDFGPNDGGVGASIVGEGDAQQGTSDYPSRLVFSVTRDGESSPTERLRISNDGWTNLFVTNNDGFQSRNSVAAGTGNAFFVGRHSATNTANGTISYAVYTNGNVQNTNGSYTTLSDAKLKENIVDAGSQWDDLKAIQIRNWNFKEETGHETHRQIGPIAQELEAVCPGLVFETTDRDEDGNETGEVTKGVNQSVLYMKAVKALQEAMERIEALEADVAQLKGA